MSDEIGIATIIVCGGVPWDDDVDDRDDPGGDCHWCGGEGWDECDDYFECTSEHRYYKGGGGSFIQVCRCSSCGGSGLAKDMTIW